MIETTANKEAIYIYLQNQGFLGVKMLYYRHHDLFHHCGISLTNGHEYVCFNNSNTTGETGGARTSYTPFSFVRVLYTFIFNVVFY